MRKTIVAVIAMLAAMVRPHVAPAPRTRTRSVERWAAAAPAARAVSGRWQGPCGAVGLLVVLREPGRARTICDGARSVSCGIRS